jgi:hypothetical protein
MDEYKIIAEFDPDGQFNMQRVLHLVLRAGVHAYIEQTGGGCMTIYAGAQHEDSEGATRWAAIAGPGVVRAGFTLGDWCDFYVGVDDDGETMPISISDVGCNSWQDIADLIIAQARAEGASEPLGCDAIEALGLDGTGRGIIRQAARERGL